METILLENQFLLVCLIVLVAFIIGVLLLIHHEIRRQTNWLKGEETVNKIGNGKEG